MELGVTDASFGTGSSLIDQTTSSRSMINSSVTNDSLDYSDYEYQYDYDDAVTTLPMAELVPVTLAYSITLVFGICGNFLVIFAVSRYKSLRSITNAFLTSLATADLMLVLICVPVKCAAFFAFTWSFGAFLCKFVHYMQTVSKICSVMTLTVMSIERFIAILFPLRAKYICTGAHARVVILITWILAFIMAAPVAVFQTHHQVGFVRKAYWCLKKFPSPVVAILFESYMFVIIFIVPVIVMIIAYTGICCQLSHMVGARAALDASQGEKYSSVERSSLKIQTGRYVAPLYRNPERVFRDSKTKKSRFEEDKCKVIQMLIVVVALFVICWGPILINNLLVATGVLPELHIGYLKPMRQAFFLMSYMNSCTNPVVYGFMSKNFRDSFKRAIFCFFRKKRKRQPFITHSFATRTTVVNGGRQQIDHNLQTSPQDRPKQFHHATTYSFNTNI